MKKNVLVVSILILTLLASFFWAGGTKPALAETTTLATEAGISAWYDAGGTITPSAFVSAFSVVEYLTADYVIGTVDIPVYVDEYNPQVLVHSSGYIVAFYPKADPAAKMIDVMAKTLDITLLEYAVVMVGAAGGLTVGDVSYYDFSSPAATNMLVLAEDRADGENAFSLTMPATGYTYYDKSYGFYQTYFPEFALNGVNFVLDNADFVGEGYYGSIFGHFYEDPDPNNPPVITDLEPGYLSNFTVDSGSTSAFGAIVVTYSYTTEGTFTIVGTDQNQAFNLVAPGTMGSTSFDYLPGAFFKTSPADGAIGQTLNPKLDWSDSTAPNYEYCIDTFDNDVCDAAWVSTGNISEVTLNGLLFDTTYYWQVRAFNSAGTVEADSRTWWSFTTEAIKDPAAFAKLSPISGTADLSPNGVVLDWEDSYGAYSYEYCVNTSQSCTTWVKAGTATTAVVDLAFETTYYWQVRAVNTNFTTLADGGYWSFSTLDTFSKLTPADGATNQKTRLTLTWEKLGTSTYKYCLTKTDIAPTTCETWVDTGTATKVTVSLTAGATYYWQVRANNGTTVYIYANDDNDDETSDYWSFTTKARTAPTKKLTFEKISPQDGVTDIPTTVTLKWTNVGATKYEYCYADTVVTVDKCTWNNAGTATSFTISGLTYPTTYYWQVRATLTDETVVYADKGAFWEFTTEYNKLEPADHTDGLGINAVTLKWQAVTGAIEYQYCLSTNEYCTVEKYVTAGTNSQMALDNLDYATTYYWQVRALVGTTWVYADGSQSDVWRFTTEELVKISPASGSITQPVNITLDWGEVSGAIEYQYCLVTVPGCTTWLSTAANSSNTITGLDYLTTYYWQVRANVGAVDAPVWLYADGFESAFWSFTTEGLVKISPLDGALDQPVGGITLDWGDVSAAFAYEYCYATTTGCTSWKSTTDLASSVELSDLAYNTTYYWQVRANLGTEAAPDWVYADEELYWQFTTEGLAKLSPADGAFDQPIDINLDWGEVSEAVEYQYCLTTGDCAEADWVSTSGATSRNLTGLAYSTTYYWQVRANVGTVDDPVWLYADGSDTAYWSFTTIAEPLP